jgi:hypothetical protein
LEANAGSDEEGGIGDESSNSGKCSEVAGGVTRESEGIAQLSECLTLHADTALSGEKVAIALDRVVAVRGVPKSIIADNGTEFASKAMDLWAYTNGVHLDFIRPGRWRTVTLRALRGGCVMSA